MQNIDLSVFDKQKFTINGDENRVLELNTSDMNIVVRLEEVYPKLQEISDKIADDKAGDAENAAKFLKEADEKMREYIDYIFDSNVCEVCAPFGNMYDPIKGFLRYEILIEKLLALYDDNLNKEAKKLKSRVEQHTKKYTGK